MRAVLALAWLLACSLRAAADAPPRPHVYLVIVDGLAARVADAAHMPRLFEAVAHEPAHSSLFPDAHAVMPARTNPNHVTLLTGAYPDAHGITGNAYRSRAPGAPPEKLDDAALIKVETLFTVAETDEPSLATMAALGKPKLARLFAGVPARQRAPDMLWSPERLPPARRDPASGYAPDAETMGAVLALAAAAAAAGDAAEPLARVAALARAAPGVAEVLARLPVPNVPTLGAVHPGWHLDHPRTGDLLLVAAPGHQFVDPFDPVEAGLLGNHGGPEDLAVPLVVTGGWAGLRAAPRGTPSPGSVDVAPTIAALLGLRVPRLLDGRAVPPARAGHPIAALLAQSPH